MPVLTGVDLLGIQRYVFASNRLRDVVGSSELVNRACGKGPLKDIGVTDEEILIAAGGNIILRFDGIQRATEIVSSLSRTLIDRYPGIEAVVAHHEYASGIRQALLALMKKVARAKQKRVPSLPLPGVAVTALCRETSLPANEFDWALRAPVSKGIALARSARADAIESWSAFLPKAHSLAGYELAYPPEIDDMGRTRGETSMVGVVHIDGNAVGRKLRDWLEAPSHDPDETFEKDYRAISHRLSALGHAALEAVLARAIDSLRLDASKQPTIGGAPTDLSFALKTDGTTAFLPMMPVLLGGDDLTFICDGRIALDLAQTALQAFRDAEPLPHLGRIGAAAGVAIVHAHAPFFRTYAMAEDLCRSAKRSVIEQDCAFAIDWQIGLGRPDESIEFARDAEYRSGKFELTSRPYELDGDAPRTWQWLARSVVCGFRDEPWKSRRNKVLSLRSIARAGPMEVKKNLEAWRVLDRELRFPGNIPDEGFDDGSRTPLIDAVELLDLHLDLRPESAV